MTWRFHGDWTQQNPLWQQAVSVLDRKPTLQRSGWSMMQKASLKHWSALPNYMAQHSRRQSPSDNTRFWKFKHLLWLNCPVTAKAVGFTAVPIVGWVSWAMRALWFGNCRDCCWGCIMVKGHLGGRFCTSIPWEEYDCGGCCGNNMVFLGFGCMTPCGGCCCWEGITSPCNEKEKYIYITLATKWVTLYN